MITIKKDLLKTTSAYRFFGTVSKLVFHPGGFYKEFTAHSGYLSAVFFLLSFSVLFAVLASIFVTNNKVFYGLIFFLNAFSMPFITALLLYLTSIVICQKTFTYQVLFGITAYANVVLIAAWIPGLGWMTGLLKFYLIGLGMVKVGRIGSIKAFLCILSTAAILLFCFRLLEPVFAA